jgi:hypothetical protein
MKLSRIISLLSVTALIAVHCTGNNSSNNNNGGSSGGQLGTTETLSNMSDAMSADASAVVEPPPLPPVAVVPAARTEIPANLHPRVRITAPRANATVTGDALDVVLAVQDWPAPEDRRHIHLILDNGPYIRIDNPRQPHHLTGLTPGTHTLRAFPGWGTHESVKTDGAFAMVTFNVGRRSNENNPAPRQPLLTYSRPKGDYNGADANRILLDFYLTNVPTLSATGFRVRYTIDGTTTGELTNWVPHFIENLPDGAHTIALDLLAANGQLAPGPFNHAERSINVSRVAPADGGHGAHTASTATDGGAPMPVADGGH